MFSIRMLGIVRGFTVWGFLGLILRALRFRVFRV